METITIDKQILEQMDRQINLAYWLAGIVITIAIFVIGYQVFINTKTIASLKKENKKNIKKSAKELFKISLQASIKLGGFNRKEIEGYLKVYKYELEEDEDILNLLQIIKVKTIREIIHRYTNFSLDISEQDIKIIMDSPNNSDELNDLLNRIGVETKNLKENIIRDVNSVKALFFQYGV